jgi:type IV secretion system protein TrbL
MKDPTHAAENLVTELCGDRALQRTAGEGPVAIAGGAIAIAGGAIAIAIAGGAIAIAIAGGAIAIAIAGGAIAIAGGAIAIAGGAIAIAITITIAVASTGRVVAITGGVIRVGRGPGLLVRAGRLAHRRVTVAGVSRLCFGSARGQAKRHEAPGSSHAAD